MKRLAFALTALVVTLAVSSCAVGVRQPATEITETSATLNGTVLSTTGGPGSYYIEYGTTPAQTQRTPTRAIDFTTNTIYPVSEPISGLTPGTTYHYAVCAEDSENPGDPFCSPDQTFRTVGDSVVGEANFLDGLIRFDVRSGPSGEDPQGTVTAVFGSFSFPLPVTCLEVSGNTAVVAAVEGETRAGVFGNIYWVEDHGVGEDRMGVFGPTFGLSCAPGGGFLTEVETGDIVVTDADPSPITKD